MVMTIATTMDIILNTFEITLPSATVFPSTVNNIHERFIKKCSPIGHQRLKFHFQYIQLKYIPPTNVTPKAINEDIKSLP